MLRTLALKKSRIAMMLALSLCGSTAQAAIYTVGGDVDCNYATVQQAIDALPTGGTHEIRIATSASCVRWEFVIRVPVNHDHQCWQS